MSYTTSTYSPTSVSGCLTICGEFNYVYIGNNNTRNISKINVYQGTIVNSASVNQDNGIGITIDSNYVWFLLRSGTYSVLYQYNKNLTLINGPIDVGGAYPQSIVSNGTYVWIAISNNGLTSFSVYNIQTSSYTQPIVNVEYSVTQSSAMSINGNYLWVAATLGNVLKIDISTPSSSSLAQAINVSSSGNIQGVVSDGTYCWATDGYKVYQINISSSLIVNSFVVSGGPSSIVSVNNDIWVSTFTGYVNQINKTSYQTLNTFQYSDPPSNNYLNGITAIPYTTSYNDIWVTSYEFNVVTRIYVPPPPPCFLYDSKILTNKGYRPIQDLRKGDLVKTLKHYYKPIDMIGKRDMNHPASQERIKNQLYKCAKDKYPELNEDLIITGCHSILVDSFKTEEEMKKAIEVNEDRLCVTDDKFRLPSCVDVRASVYETPGEYTVYHLALENEDYFSNYGIYANGLLVETCSKRYLKELSGMDLIE